VFDLDLKLNLTIYFVMNLSLIRFLNFKTSSVDGTFD
jgi:hypothetical protein